MARLQKVSTLREMVAIQRALRLKAEAGLVEAQQQLQNAEAERTEAGSALLRAETDWQEGLASGIYPPDWLRALGERVIKRDHGLSGALAAVRESEQAQANCETTLRFADAKQQVATHAHKRARIAEARRREERQAIDRPAKAPVR